MTNLRTAPLIALGCITVCVVTVYGERHRQALRRLRRDIVTYGEERYGEGVIDAHALSRPLAPVRSLRR